MANIVQDISVITKIVGCDYEFYNSQNNTVDPYYESTLYLVNNGVDIDSENHLSYTDLYYGSRKLSDTLIVESVPGESYPNDKIYLQPIKDDNNNIIGYQIYFKHDNIVTQIASVDQVVSVDSYEDGILTLRFNSQTASIPCINYNQNTELWEWSIPTTLYNELVDDVLEQVIIPDPIYWQPIVPSQ